MKRRNRIKVALRQGASRAFVLGPLAFLLVAGAGCPSLFESPTQRATHIKQAEVGRDGVATISAANTVVNAYAALAGATDPAIADTTITVASIATLNSGNGLFTTNLAQGDLLLIVQMAGATINLTDTAPPNGYGTVAALGNAGHYEFVGVESVAGNVITLACGLKNDYSLTGKTQVIRVPQYTTLTINTGASITAPAWNGITGGVVAVHAETTLQLSGSINVSAKGFRGGATDNFTGAAGTAVTLYRSTLNTDGAEKGEGIAGYQVDYGTGAFGRGAPANAGGGGDSHNAGGGGGANAPSGAAWSGQGVMEQCAAAQAFRPAWQLDDSYIANPAGANTCTNSEGGGRGGYSYSSAAQNPLTDGPGAEAVGACAGGTGWGGNCRRPVGGLGGHPVTNDPTSRLFMGGGGGAGDGNNNAAGRGGNGGGLVFVIAGAIAGTGTIVANGEAGANAVFSAGGGDAPGGGGGGGTVVVHAASLSAVSISVNGGKGGDQVGSSGANEVEGPGGGGGGGYIAVSGGTPINSATGGPAGTTDRGVMATFAVDGATAGNAGLTNGNAISFLYCGTTTAPVTTIATFPADPSNNPTGTFTFTNSENPVTYECSLNGGTTWASCTASYTTPTLADGSHTLSVRSTDLSGNVENPPVTHTWTIDTVPPVTTIATFPSDPSSSATGTFTFTNSKTPVTYECKIDSGAFVACTDTYTTGVLTNGSHTLTVRSTDQAGNVETTPPTFTWAVLAVGLDGGVDTEEPPAVDVGVDSGGEEVPAVLLDAQAVDVLAGEDLLVTGLDVSEPDLAADTVVVVGDDTAPVVSVDAAVDAETVDLSPLLDVGAIADVRVPVLDVARADVLTDTQAVGAEPSPDTAPVPEPNADTAGPVVIEDAAVPPANKDAAPATEDLKIMGSGFCAIASSRSTSPAPFMVLGLAGLALLLRRRRKS